MMNAQPKCNRCGQPGYTHGNYSDCITYLKTRVALADSEAVAGTNRAERAEARIRELEAGKEWRTMTDTRPTETEWVHVKVKAHYRRDWHRWETHYGDELTAIDGWLPLQPQ